MTVEKSASPAPAVRGSTVTRDSAAIATSWTAVCPTDVWNVRRATVGAAVGLSSAIRVSKKPLTTPSARKRRNWPLATLKGGSSTSPSRLAIPCDAGAKTNPARDGVAVTGPPGGTRKKAKRPAASVVVEAGAAPSIATPAPATAAPVASTTWPLIVYATAASTKSSPASPSSSVTVRLAGV